MPTPHKNDNDQHYKTLFRTFLRNLLEITHPDLVPQRLFHEARFLDKETYTDLLDGAAYKLDLVCEIPTVDGGCRLLLIHIEIEERTPRGKHKVPFAQRMANYIMTQSVTASGSC